MRLNGDGAVTRLPRAAAPVGHRRPVTVTGGEYPNRGWSGYSYEPGWSYGYEPSFSVGFSDYGWSDGRRVFRDRDYRRYGMRGYREGIRGREFNEGRREFTEGRRGVIRTGANVRTDRSTTVGVGTNVRAESGSANFNGGANATVGAGGGNIRGAGGARGRNRH